MVYNGVSRIHQFNTDYDALCENMLKIKTFQKENEVVADPNAKGAKGKTEARPALEFSEVFGEPQITFVGLEPKEEAKAGKK